MPEDDFEMVWMLSQAAIAAQYTPRAITVWSLGGLLQTVNPVHSSNFKETNSSSKLVPYI